VRVVAPDLRANERFASPHGELGLITARVVPVVDPVRGQLAHAQRQVVEEARL
jgi:hypothetical protein